MGHMAVDGMPPQGGYCTPQAAITTFGSVHGPSTGNDIAVSHVDDDFSNYYLVEMPPPGGIFTPFQRTWGSLCWCLMMVRCLRRRKTHGVLRDAWCPMFHRLPYHHKTVGPSRPHSLSQVCLLALHLVSRTSLCHTMSLKGHSGTTQFPYITSVNTLSLHSASIIWCLTRHSI